MGAMLRMLDFSAGTNRWIGARRRNGIFSDNLPPECGFRSLIALVTAIRIAFGTPLRRAFKVVDIERERVAKTGRE